MGKLARGGAVAVLLAILALTPPLRAAEVPDQIVERRVSFAVRIINRSALPCPTSGASAVVVGRLVGPESVLDGGGPAAVTLYLHEFSFGKWFWHFPDPAYDYATLQAEAGHVSVLIDRIGYGESTHPNGYLTCLGADADIDYQIVQQLRAGSYQVDGGAPTVFERVVLAGHSGGAMAAEIAAYSFGGIDGLIVFAHADVGFSALGLGEGLRQGTTCLLGGDRSQPGYAYFGATAGEWVRDYFAGAEDRIAQQATPMRHRDPCGDVGSFPTGAIVNILNARRINVPVLLLYGMADALYDQPAAGVNQQRLMAGNPDVTLKFFEGSGHALTLQRTAPEVRASVADWLTTRGLG